MAHVTLVLGGARSGKSRYAEGLVTASPRPWVYVATAEARDEEMAERIGHHRERRGPDWRTVEEPLDLANGVAGACQGGGTLLVDCLTLWVSNLIGAGRDVHEASERLVQTLGEFSGRVVIVSNEVGLGIVPANALAREFRDEAGRLNQMIAEVADEVVFMVAGLPMRVKG